MVNGGPMITVVQNFVGMAELATLPDRFNIAFNATLAIKMGEAADQIVEDAAAQLTPGHGYDTGLLKESLTKKLVEIVGGVFYEIYSPEADYWAYVEFGHMLRNGDWWEGYHYIANAMAKNDSLIWGKAREAFVSACAITRGGVSAAAAGGDLLIDWGQ